VSDPTTYQALKAEMIRLITLAAENGGVPRLDRLVLNNREAGQVLKMAPAKVSQIPLSELPRRGGKGRGGVKISVVALVDYLLRKSGLDNQDAPSGASAEAASA
jgi:hypothetical protein